MKIKIDEITEEGLSFDLTEEGKSIGELAGAARFSIVSPVVAHIEMRRSGVNIDIDGTLGAKVSLVCSRCLKDFEFPIESGFTNRLELGSPGQREVELTKDEIEVTFFEGKELDTSLIIMEQISLELPIKPLCSEDCRGLCPECGVNLNEGLCECRREGKTDLRFAKLGEFKIK